MHSKMPKTSTLFPKTIFLALSQSSHKCPFHRLSSNLTTVVCQKLPQIAKNHPILPKTKLLAHSLLFLALPKSSLTTEIPPFSPPPSPIIPFPKSRQKSCQKFPHSAKNKIFGITPSFFSVKLLIMQSFLSTFLFIFNNFHLPKTPFSKNTMSWQKLFILLADFSLSSSPSSFPSLPPRNFPEKNQEKKQKLLPHPYPHTLKIPSIFSLLFSLFPSPSGLVFLFRKRKKSSETQCFQGIGEDLGKKKEEEFAGVDGFGRWGFEGGWGKWGKGEGKGEDPGDWCSSRSSVCYFILFL